ncbi:U3 snoRNP protein [Borealophlyctis nickersoniae]|nr:U3 snoRNP protein [Borealophlyctis nickersoniae]
MADAVHYHLEKMVPELEDLEKRGIFSKTEIKSIVKRRTDLEYAIHRLQPLKSDFLRYIEYEINLDRLRRKRKRRMHLNVPQKQAKREKNKLKGSPGVKEKTSLSDYSLLRRIHGLYQKMLRRFGGDMGLWVQYFEWSRAVGSSKALGRSFARAIQLHPTKPTFWIMAAAWEFEENGNMNSARILLQRGIRLNTEDKTLWHEYFKLELLFIEKVKERRKILFGDGANGRDAAAENVNGDEEVEAADRTVSLPGLSEEKGLGMSALEQDETIAATTSDEANVSSMGEKLTPMQRTLLEVVVPRVIYRNAVQAIPHDLQFRIGFLQIYRKFGPETKIGQEEIYESLRKDFPNHPTARAVLAERHLAGITPVDPKYPAALKSCVTEFDACVVEIPLPEMWAAYADFLAGQLNACDEENLKKYLKASLLKTYTRTASANLATPQTYVSWSALTSPAQSLTILQKGVENIPTSAELWLARIARAGNEEKEGLFERACAAVGGMEGRWKVWEEYLKWCVGCWEGASGNGSGQAMEVDEEDGSSSGGDDDDEQEEEEEEEAETSSPTLNSKTVTQKFETALSRDALGGTEHESAILEQYMKWSYRAGGITQTRALYDRLIAERQRKPEFFRTCVKMEERNVKDNGKGMWSAESVGRVRKLWEAAVVADSTDTATWLDYIRFEMDVAKDMQRATRLHWRAGKEVVDKDGFMRSYEAMKAA